MRELLPQASQTAFNPCAESVLHDGLLLSLPLVNIKTDMVRIGLLSDTHSYWDDKYVKHFEECDEVVLNLNWKSAPLGSNSCGPLPNEALLIKPQNFKFSMNFKGFVGGEMNDATFFTML